MVMNSEGGIQLLKFYNIHVPLHGLPKVSWDASGKTWSQKLIKCSTCMLMQGL